MRVTAARQLTSCCIFRDSFRTSTNAWKKLINCGDVFEFVAGSIVWNDELWII
jgi:hypothetical protein